MTPIEGLQRAQEVDQLVQQGVELADFLQNDGLRRVQELPHFLGLLADFLEGEKKGLRVQDRDLILQEPVIFEDFDGFRSDLLDLALGVLPYFLDEVPVFDF